VVEQTLKNVNEEGTTTVMLGAGVVVVEVVFVYPGMGQYMVDSVAKRDVPVVQACGLIFAAVYVGLNGLANPRLRHPR